MHVERRESLRIRASVPCAWRLYDAVPERRRLIRDFSVTSDGVGVERLLAIDHELHTLLGVEALDATVREALILMNDKIDAVAHETLFALPDPVPLELGMGGVRLPEPLALEADHVVGLELLADLPAPVRDHRLRPVHADLARQAEGPGRALTE